MSEASLLGDQRAVLEQFFAVLSERGVEINSPEQGERLAHAVAAAPVGAGGDGAAAEEEKDSFDVVLTGAGDKKIQVIKEVRALTSLGLKEAKDLVDGAPKPVLEKVAKEQADAAKETLEGAGASVEIK